MSLGLLGAYQSGSEDSDSNSSDEDVKDEVKPEVKETVPVLDNPFGSGGSRPLLPQPSFMQEQHSKVQGVRYDSSVFSNPFRDKEDKKAAILEQHVNMTQRQEDMKMIDGVKVCWMSRKGRCRQGSKCKFAHDSDVKTDQVREVKYDADSQISSDKAAKGAVEQIKFGQMQNEWLGKKEDEEEAVIRKKRPGLSQGLVPSKRAMIYHKKVYS